MLLSDRSRRELADLHERLGIQSRSDLIRLAIRKLYAAEFGHNEARANG